MVHTDLSAIQSYFAQKAADRKFDLDPSKQLLLLTEEVGELAKAIRKTAGIGFSATTTTADAEEEIADVFIVLMMIANGLGIDVQQAVTNKEIKNCGREWN